MPTAARERLQEGSRDDNGTPLKHPRLQSGGAHPLPLARPHPLEAVPGAAYSQRRHMPPLEPMAVQRTQSYIKNRPEEQREGRGMQHAVPLFA